MPYAKIKAPILLKKKKKKTNNSFKPLKRQRTHEVNSSLPTKVHLKKRPTSMKIKDFEEDELEYEHVSGANERKRHK